MDLHEIRLLDNHQDIVDRFLAACQADDHIVTAFLTGSCAKGTADKFSDLDLFMITTDEAYEDFLVERASFIHLLGKPLLIEDFGRVSCVIFSNAAEVDIWFGCESKLQDISCGPYKALLDKKGILAGRVFPPRVADRTEQIELLRQQIDGFWHELSHFIKAMGRGQLWFAYGQIEAMRQICVVLARLRYNFSDAYVGGGEPYFKIEQALPVEELLPLQTTFSRWHMMPCCRPLSSSVAFIEIWRLAWLRHIT